MKNSNSKYFGTLILSFCYNIICILSLIFATGVGKGIKLDDNQLIGYIVIILCFGITFFAFFIKTTRIRRISVLIIMILNILFVALPYIDVLNFNEAMFLFLLPSSIFFLLTLFFACDFIITTRKRK